MCIRDRYNAKADLVEKAQMYKNCAISIGGEVAPEARVAICLLYTSRCV